MPPGPAPPPPRPPPAPLPAPAVPPPGAPARWSAAPGRGVFSQRGVSMSGADRSSCWNSDGLAPAASVVSNSRRRPRLAPMTLSSNLTYHLHHHTGSGRQANVATRVSARQRWAQACRGMGCQRTNPACAAPQQLLGACQPRRPAHPSAPQWTAPGPAPRHLVSQSPQRTHTCKGVCVPSHPGHPSPPAPGDQTTPHLAGSRSAGCSRPYPRRWR